METYYSFNKDDINAINQNDARNFHARDYILRLAAIALDCPCETILPWHRDRIIKDILPLALEDLEAYHTQDPSIRHKPVSCIASPHSTFFAVLAYRIAHRLIAEQTPSAQENAMRLSFYARSQTGIDIHPEAQIGRRFVIDHGWGVVIGQTTVIGNDCYILNDVILGARTVSNASEGKRHPTIGNRVQICAKVRIFGPVTIGDDCFIGPDVTVLHDAAPGTRLLRATEPPVWMTAAAISALAGVGGAE
ncbi:serine O-acetyltransferase [Allorhizobium undicola]|uniref:serine O-acetyltransferase n=1 Tax=Allorhizobium undicola TaxID=78527 RepID=UPI003D34C870